MKLDVIKLDASSAGDIELDDATLAELDSLLG